MTPPNDLDPVAQGKFAELAQEIGDPDSLTVDAITSYCRAFGDEQHALRLLAQMPNPFLTDADGKIVLNPLRAVIKQARAEMQRLRKELRAPRPATTDYPRRLLAEIDRRHRAIADAKPKKDEVAAWEAQLEHGPLFQPCEWFDCAGEDAERMRWTRALATLTGEGLVITNRETGAKWANVRLTPAGQAALTTG